jgi:hypothetical protein
MSTLPPWARWSLYALGGVLTIALLLFVVGVYCVIMYQP